MPLYQLLISTDGEKLSGVKGRKKNWLELEFGGFYVKSG
jgi:hypothetical protein